MYYIVIINNENGRFEDLVEESPSYDEACVILNWFQKKVNDGRSYRAEMVNEKELEELKEKGA